MKLSSLLVLITVLTITFSSCAPSENERLIKGNWQGIEWLENGAPSGLNATGTAFSFKDGGDYTFDYGSTKQTGTYKIENDMLFTTPQGDREIMVKIVRLTKDTLVFDMNRSGRPEQLTLIRK